MIFKFDERFSDSPFVERIWRTQSERTGDFLSVAASQWEMVVSKYQDQTTITVRGPVTIAASVHVNLMQIINKSEPEQMSLLFKTEASS